MITLKSSHEIEAMRRAGKITAAARAVAREMVKPGVTTQQIDQAVYRFIKSQGAIPSFLNYNGYPASVCVSVNDEIIHGIPGKRVLQEGDIVSVDVGAFIGGVHGDCAGTYPCGQVSDEALRLIRITQQSFFEGIKYAREGHRLSDISAAGRRMWRPTAARSCVSMSVTALADTCTSRPRCRTTASPDTAPACCGA